MKKQNKNKKGSLWALMATLFALLMLLSISAQLAGNKNVSALGIKCMRLDGTMDQSCLRVGRSRKIKTTYASGQFRRSRSGANWKNYKNRENTRLARKNRNTRERKSQILNSMGLRLRYSGFYYKVDTIQHLLLNRALKRRIRANKFMRKFESIKK